MRVLALVLAIVVATVVAVWLIAGLTAANAIESVVKESWPAGLGTLESVEARVRPQTTNDAARRLKSLAAPLRISFETPSTHPAVPVHAAIGEYLKAEQVRADATIGAPPAEVMAHLAAHEKEIDALRDHLLQPQTIQWDLQPSQGFDGPLPNLLGHMQVARLLTARALERGRANDVRSWDDLHAAWRVAQSLEPRPELICQMIVLAIARQVNSVAWKLPPAAAEWFPEVLKVDHLRLLLRAHQYDTWLMARHLDSRMPGFKWAVAKPYLRWSVINIARHQRHTAEELASMTVCTFDGVAFAQQQQDAIPRWNIPAKIATPNIGGAWQRAFRTIAEHEATANAMRIVRGQPIVEASACSDGAWKYDGARISFSRDLPKSSPAETPMPLSLAIPARATRQST